MDKKVVVHIHNGILLGHKKEHIWLRFDDADEPRIYYTDWVSQRKINIVFCGTEDFTFTFHFHALEEEMATHSSVLAWRIPGMAGPWAAIYGVSQSWTWLKRLSSSSSSSGEIDIENRLMDMGRGEERVRRMKRVRWKLTFKKNDSFLFEPDFGIINYKSFYDSFIHNAIHMNYWVTIISPDQPVTLSYVWLCQAPLSMEFPGQEYWSGLPFPSLGDLPDPVIKSSSLTLRADSSPSEPPGKDYHYQIL